MSLMFVDNIHWRRYIAFNQYSSTKYDNVCFLTNSLLTGLILWLFWSSSHLLILAFISLHLSRCLLIPHTHLALWRLLSETSLIQTVLSRFRQNVNYTTDSQVPLRFWILLNAFQLTVTNRKTDVQRYSFRNKTKKKYQS